MKRSVAEVHSLHPEPSGVSRTIAESTYRRIRQDILWGRVAPGSPLRSDELRTHYGVGISPLREALTRLVSERLVTSVGQRGFRVAPLTAYDVEDTMATRIIIESEALARSIRQDILWGRVAPGSPLRSDELRTHYGVGISPLREALTRLVSERLVTSVGQRGFRVAPLTAYDVEDTMATRIIIESEALARSIRHGDMAWETALVAAFHALSRHPVPKDSPAATEHWAMFHRQFHMALLSACGSRWLVELAGLLFDQAERHRILRTKFGPQKVLKRDTGREHKQIFDAALARDAKAAVRALERHYQTTAEQVASVLARMPKASARRA